jgi:WD40 repeat protein
VTRARRLTAWAVLSGLAAAGCGSRLGVRRSPDEGTLQTNPTPTQGVPRLTLDAAAAPGDAQAGGGPLLQADAGAPDVPGTSAPGAGGTPAVELPDASVDAGGISLAPVAPLTCPTATAAPIPSVPVGSCGAQLALSSSVTLGPPPIGHFYRCGAMGPEIATDVRLSPDGRRLATLTGAGTVRLFATDDWREVGQLGSATGRIQAFAFSPDGSRLATLSLDAGQIIVWDTAQGNPIQTFSGAGTVGGIAALKTSLAFSRDGSKLVSPLSGIIDLRSGTTVRLAIDTWYVDELAFTACDSMVYARFHTQTGDSNLTLNIALFDAATGSGQTLFSGWDSYSGGAALSADGALVAVSSTLLHNGTGQDLSIYRADTGEQIGYLPSWKAGQIQAFTPAGDALLISDSSAQLDEWRLADGLTTRLWSFPDGAAILGFPTTDSVLIASASDTFVGSLQTPYRITYYLPGGTRAAGFSADGVIGAAIVADGSLFHVWKGADRTPLCNPTAPTPTAAVTSFALSGDGKVLGTGKADGVIELFDAKTGARTASVETIQGPIRNLALSGDGQRAATELDSSSPVLVWSSDGSLVGSVAVPGATATSFPSHSFALSPDGLRLGLATSTSARGQDSISGSFVDVASGTTETMIQPMGFWATGAPFSPDSTHVAARLNGAVTTWPIAGGLPDDILVAPPEAAGLWNLTMSSDWSLAAATSSAAVVVWDPRQGSVALNWAPAGLQVSSVLSLANGAMALQQYLGHLHASDFWSTRIYDLPTGAELRRFDSATGNVLLSPDGQRAYSLSGPDVIAWCR